MDIRNSLDGLNSLLGTSPSTTSAKSSARNTAAGSAAWGNDQVTFSSAASEVSLAASDSGVRMDKVASVQAALAAGTYDVPASAVAGKLVDAMLSGGR